MNLELTVKGVGGHTEAIFHKEKITISFSKTDDRERGVITQLVEKGKKEGMTLHSVDKEGNLKELTDETLLEKIFKSKGEVALLGTVDSVKKMALDVLEKEIRDNGVVTQLQDDGSWKILKEKSDFKEEGEKQKVTSSKVPGGG